jgi:hypothetical protein
MAHRQALFQQRSSLPSAAQQPAAMRRIVLMNFAAGDSGGGPSMARCYRGLRELGWTLGRNMLYEYR